MHGVRDVAGRGVREMGAKGLAMIVRHQHGVIPMRRLWHEKCESSCGGPDGKRSGRARRGEERQSRCCVGKRSASHRYAPPFGVRLAGADRGSRTREPRPRTAGMEPPPALGALLPGTVGLIQLGRNDDRRSWGSVVL